MSSTGLDAFDETVQKTDIWLKELMEDLHLESRRRAYEALRGVLHAVRDRLSTNEVAHLAAQLPMLVRGFYYEGWDPEGPGISREQRNREAFLNQVSREIPYEASREDPARLATAVLRVLKRHISQTEYEQIRQTFPEDIRALWPSGAESGEPMGERRAA